MNMLLLSSEITWLYLVEHISINQKIASEWITRTKVTKRKNGHYVHEKQKVTKRGVSS